ncbi:GNAT family N-acetyltransferase [Schlegelella sp. S2-27]|uniref:GNAT family N-acetyltransferase n=1 Tax=Caldimonas mangrovi TaxID=2944811 RepID=A0ABT0YSH4_9BURK|nr:GNAT family N-acetyltransferase [Caldimonas mangrovi]MCM5681583.1 GNAT family N-acetyltransferase [Caldimonas mangrovi]
MQVDLVSPPQYESLVELLRELHTYYHEGSSVSREMVRSHLVDNLLGPDSPLRLVVAYENDVQVCGLAAISLTYSLVEPAPDQRRHCQLKELYVRSSHRSRGVGRALMSWMAQYAADHGCHRIDWPVKASNARGIAFYRGLGAQQVVERLSFRLAEPHLGELASQSRRAGGG